MRTAICLSTLLLVALALSGCGNPYGALQAGAPPDNSHLSADARAALGAFFASPLAAAEPDLDNFPRQPGRLQKSIQTEAQGQPLPVTYETSLEPVDGGFRITLVLRWPESGGEAFSAVIYEVSAAGEVSVAGYDGQPPPTH